jgi:hypothetical protein
MLKPHRPPAIGVAISMLILSAMAVQTEVQAATVHTEIHVDVAPAFAWLAIRDVGSVHTRQARGFIVDDVLIDGVRTITFRGDVTPRVVKERIVTIDDQDMRVAYGAIETRATFHASSLQVVPEGKGCKLVWITDILPDGFKDGVRHNMELGMEAMKKTLEEDAKLGTASR